MDMKNLITNFRQFARERKKAKLLKIKMSRYTIKYQKGAQPVLRNVIVEIVQGSAIFFYNSNDERFYFLRDIDIISFDDQVPPVVTLLVNGEENEQLEFVDEQTQMNFVAALSAFLQHSNHPSPGARSDSGISTPGTLSPPH